MESSGKTRSYNPLGTIALMLAFALLALSVYTHFTIGLWGDQDWELLVATMMVKGKKLYIDHFPVNPPLLFWLYTLPAALSLYTGAIKDFQALVLLVLGAVALTIYACSRIIAVHPGFAGNKNLCLQFAILLCFLFVFRIAMPFFGDREHIFLVLTFPYLLRWMPGLTKAQFPRGLRILIGCLAAIGFLIKPHCLILFAGLQLICLLRRNHTPILGSIENCIIYAAGLAYAISIYIFTPEYIFSVMPMAYLTYSAISAGPSTLFDYTIIITLGLTFIFFRTRYSSPYRKDIYYLLEVSVFLLLYGIVNAGWGYTFQPIITLLLFLNGFVLWEFLYLRKKNLATGLPVTLFGWGVAACLLNFAAKIFIVLIYYYFVFTSDCHVDNSCARLYDEYTREVNDTPHHTFGMIGMNFALWTRVSKLSGAEWVTRFPQFWMMPKFIISDPAFISAHQWILYYVAGALTDDLEHNKPDLVFVDKSDVIYTIGLSKPFDWVGGFSTYENFRDAWSHYRFVHTLDSCDKIDPTQEIIHSMMHEPAVRRKSNCMYDVYKRVN